MLFSQRNSGKIFTRVYSNYSQSGIGATMNQWDSYKSSIFLCYQRLADDMSFAIISAQNPAGIIVNPFANQLLDMQFQAHLQQIGVPYRSVIGTAPDYSFQEKSWIVLCDKEQAISLARLFTQNAIYWIEQNQLYLVPVLLQQKPEEHLGVFQQRLVVLPG